jgi:hypothetical protein
MLNYVKEVSKDGVPKNGITGKGEIVDKCEPCLRKMYPDLDSINK